LIGYRFEMDASSAMGMKKKRDSRSAQSRRRCLDGGKVVTTQALNLIPECGV